MVLAPMAGVTDRPFRSLCRKLGAALAVSEMVTADATLYASRKTLRRLDHRGETGPIAVQIVGAEPRSLADAARVNVDNGAQIIDINMGCPAKKVCKRAAGSALMRDEALVADILHSVVRAVQVPVSLKIRTGWDPQSRNAVRIAQIAEDCGIASLAVHGRTRACGYAGQAEYATIRTIKQTVSIPVIANGDIDNPQKAKQVLAYTGADGVMIGRAAQGRPWIFAEIAHYLQTGRHLPEPQADWIRRTLLEHLHALYEFYGEPAGVRIARKHIAWYSRSRRDAANFRAQVFKSQTKQQQLDVVQRFFDQLSVQEELAA